MIKLVQLDPNGLCNAGCWFCPVAYASNPEIGKKTMPVETIRNILDQLKAGMGIFVDPSFGFIYTAHYNEVLLYKHFEEMLQLFREYKVGTMVLTNGIPLTKEKVDIIKQYQDVVWNIHFNIPSANADTWSKMTGMNSKIHSKVMANVRYAIDSLNPDRISMQVNGVQESSTPSKGGWMTLLDKAPQFNLDDSTGDTAVALKELQILFPEIKITINSSLVDRAGYLDKSEIVSNHEAIQKIKGDKTRVIGCNNMGSRPDTWLHINANGDVFICCNDYDFETVFGNIYSSSIQDIWGSSERLAMIENSYKNLCTTCVHAVWE